MTNAFKKHVEEIAEEVGEEFPWGPPVSDERDIPYKGHTIKYFFEETGSICPHQAFVYGIGTKSGYEPEEAVEAAKKAIDKAEG